MEFLKCIHDGISVYVGDEAPLCTHKVPVYTHETGSYMYTYGVPVIICAMGVSMTGLCGLCVHTSWDKGHRHICDYGIPVCTCVIGP